MVGKLNCKPPLASLMKLIPAIQEPFDQVIIMAGHLFQK